MRKLSMDELDRPTPEAFRQQPKTSLVLVLDNVRSALNVGSAFRTADAFGVEKIYLCGITATPPHREILKTALGSTETVAWEHFDDAAAVVASLRASGCEVWAVEQAEGSTPLQDFRCEPDGRYALVFGNEVDGVGEQVLAASNGCIEVPQVGTKHSLNIAVCLGVVAWELFRQLKFKK